MPLGARRCGSPGSVTPMSETLLCQRCGTPIREAAEFLWLDIENSEDCEEGHVHSPTMPPGAGTTIWLYHRYEGEWWDWTSQQWVALDHATIYTEQSKRNATIPIEGHWVQFFEAPF